MTDILPIAGWPNVRQLETNEFATGGANGNMNEQAKSLAARSELLKQYAALPYKSKTGGYALNERVQLATGDIVRSTIPSNVNNPNVDMTGWVKTNSASQIFDESGLSQQEVNNGVESIAALRLLTPKDKGERVYLVSANKDQNEGGGVFVSTQKSGLVDNGGTVISSANPNLFWVRVNYSQANAEMFGAKVNDPAFDSYDAIQRCVNSVSSATLQSGIYYVSEGIVIPDSFKKLTGVTQEETFIEKTTSATKNVRGTDVDFALYIDHAGADEIAYYKKFSDFSIQKSSFIELTGYGIYAHRVALSLFENIRITMFDIGVRAADAWMITWTRITAHCNNGWQIFAGTSNVFTACWTIAVTGICYSFQNLLYSVMSGCGADFCGSEGNPATNIFSISWSEITIIGQGYEKSHLKEFLYSNSSKINFINLRGLLNENKYASGYGAWITINNQSTIVFDNGTFGLKYNKSSGVQNVPNAVYIDGNSTFEERNTELFKCYTINDVVVIGANLYSDSDGHKREIIRSTTSLNKTVLSDRRYISNDGLSFSQEPDTIQYNGSYHINSSNPMGYMMLQHINHSQYTNYAFQFGAPAGESNCRNVKMRVKNNGVWSTPCIVRNTDNTTVDANGFIKSASPIVKLFSDCIETNNEVPEIVTFEKLGIGDYLIKNTNGFSAGGWYIELPQDANGNKLFAVLYKQLESGDISVKTYQKKFDPETASIVADTSKPIDIKEGRWIDIRLN